VESVGVKSNQRSAFSHERRSLLSADSQELRAKSLKASA
jgi:hypothetical protein